MTTDVTAGGENTTLNTDTTGADKSGAADTTGKTTDTTAQTPEQKAAADAAAAAVAAQTERNNKIAALEKDSKLAGEAGKKALDELTKMRAEDAAKAAEAKKGTDADKSKDGKTDEDKAGAPEKYEAFKLPEGMQFDDKAMTDFQAWAKAHNLNQKAAQELVDMQTGIMARSQEVYTAAMQTAWKETADAWVAAAKADPVIGGANYQQTLADSKAFIARFNPSPAFQEMLRITGAGNHPEFMRLTAAAGKALRGGRVEIGDKKADTAASSESLFPKSAPRS